MQVTRDNIELLEQALDNGFEIRSTDNLGDTTNYRFKWLRFNIIVEEGFEVELIQDNSKEVKKSGFTKFDNITDLKVQIKYKDSILNEQEIKLLLKEIYARKTKEHKNNSDRLRNL